MRVHFIFPLTVFACAPVLPMTRAQQLACYAAADQAAERRADAECGQHLEFLDCPAADDILDELEERQKECRP